MSDVDHTPKIAKRFTAIRILHFKFKSSMASTVGSMFIKVSSSACQKSAQRHVTQSLYLILVLNPFLSKIYRCKLILFKQR